VIQIVEIFRRPGRSFLMPPSPTPLESHTIVDLSHESLIRCWTRLIAWAEEERASAAVYARLSREASWFEEGAAGLWGNPELDIGLRWRRDTHPTAAWARRYDESFDRAMQFLDRSEKERDRLRAERDAERKQKLRRVQWAAAVLFALLVVAVVTAYVAWRENARAATNLRLAKAAVDDMLASTDRNPARVGADAPQVVEFRRELLGKAKGFYLDFIKQEPRNEALLAEMAFAHFRLGHINRLLEGADEAAQEYQQSIAQFERLARDHPMTPAYRQAVASSYNWLGETLRPSSEQYAKAEMAYSSALRLQTELFGSDPTSVEYAEELARTHYNRGILYASIAQPNDSAFGQAEADFREAIRLLGTLAAPTAPTTTNRQSSQELGRAYSNLAGLLQLDDRRLPEAKDLFERAVGSHEALMLQEPSNREYKVELVMFYDNLADALRAQGQFDAATARNEQAHDLVVTLGRPVPSLGIMEADNMTMRGRILQARGLAESARQQYQRSLEMFKTLEQQQEARRVPEFHLRFGDLLINSAALCDQRQDVTDTCRPLSQAFDFYVTVGRKAVAAGSLAEAQQVVESLSRVIAPLPPGDRIRATSAYQDLQQTLREKVAARK
jgi:tetratricopeptide (TPR) repeat protein